MDTVTIVVVLAIFALGAYGIWALSGSRDLEKKVKKSKQPVPRYTIKPTAYGTWMVFEAQERLAGFVVLRHDFPISCHPTLEAAQADIAHLEGK